MADAENKKPDSGRRHDTFISKIVADPANPPQLIRLGGYKGASSEAGHVRLYANPELSFYSDIPEGDILYETPVPADADPLGAVVLFVKRDSKIISSQSKQESQSVGGGSEAMTPYYPYGQGAQAAPQLGLTPHIIFTPTIHSVFYYCTIPASHYICGYTQNPAWCTIAVSPTCTPPSIPTITHSFPTSVPGTGGSFAQFGQMGAEQYGGQYEAQYAPQYGQMGAPQYGQMGAPQYGQMGAPQAAAPPTGPIPPSVLPGQCPTVTQPSPLTHCPPTPLTHCQPTPLTHCPPFTPLTHCPPTPLTHCPPTPLTHCPPTPLTHCPPTPLTHCPPTPLTHCPPTPLTHCPPTPLTGCPPPTHFPQLCPVSPIPHCPQSQIVACPVSQFAVCPTHTVLTPATPVSPLCTPHTFPTPATTQTSPATSAPGF